MNRIMCIAIIVAMCAYVGYDLQSQFDPYVPESVVAEEIQVWDAKPVSYIQYDNSISCAGFASQWTAQQYMDAHPESESILDPDDNGYACTEVTYGCYPSCEYERLQAMTPDEREAIGAVRYMP